MCSSVWMLTTENIQLSQGRDRIVCAHLFSGASATGVTDIVPSITWESKRENGEN